MKMQMSVKTQVVLFRNFFLFILLIIVNTLQGQMITGRTQDASTGEDIPYVTIALFNASMTTLIGGTASNEEGFFSLTFHGGDSLQLRFSAIGYETLILEAKADKENALHPGIVLMNPASFGLEGVTIEAGRIRAQATASHNTYLVNGNMERASHTSTDILRLVPGVHVDVMQNVTLEGKRNIIILVNGREYDKSFLNQLNASLIDKVEVITHPSAQYDASADGVINIVLKKNQNSGLQGHFYGEVPLSSSEIFSFPSYSLNFSRGKFNFFTSYNGEFRYFDIEESYVRNYTTPAGQQQIRSLQQVRQENWSHKFHYGMDYFINDRNQLNFYGFYNPYSQEHSGVAELFREGEDPFQWNAAKEDSDMNTANLYSVYYSHKIDETIGHELSVDAGYFAMNGSNSVRFFNGETGYDHSNHVNPGQQVITAKLDYTLPLSRNFRLMTGGQLRQSSLSDEENVSFDYENRVRAAYATLQSQLRDTEVHVGVRFEYSRASATEEGLSQNFKTWLPNLIVHHKFSSVRSLKLTGRSSVSYPGFYHLNSSSIIEDPFSISTGNSHLRTSLRYSAELEYNRRFENHFVSTRLFYHHMTDVVNTLMVFNSDGVFESMPHNLGAITQLGIQFSGALSLGQRGGIQPFVRIFEARTAPGAFARESGVEGRSQIAVASGMSAYYDLGRGFTSSVVVQYNSAVNNVQDNYYEGAQYFVSLEKDLGKGFKAGMVSAVPFANQLTYQGSDIDAADFSSHSQGNILTSVVPLWLKISYGFSTGENRNRIERNIEEPVSRKRKGF